VAARRAGIARGWAGGRPPRIERVQGGGFLPGAPAGDGGLADPSLLRDRVHADRRQAAGQQEFRGRFEDGLARLLAAWPAAPRSLGRHFRVHEVTRLPMAPSPANPIVLIVITVTRPVLPSSLVLSCVSCMTPPVIPAALSPAPSARRTLRLPSPGRRTRRLLSPGRRDRRLLSPCRRDRK